MLRDLQKKIKAALPLKEERSAAHPSVHLYLVLKLAQGEDPQSLKMMGTPQMLEQVAATTSVTVTQVSLTAQQLDPHQSLMTKKSTATMMILNKKSSSFSKG